MLNTQDLQESVAAYIWSRRRDGATSSRAVLTREWALFALDMLGLGWW